MFKNLTESVYKVLNNMNEVIHDGSDIIKGITLNNKNRSEIVKIIYDHNSKYNIGRWNYEDTNKMGAGNNMMTMDGVNVDLKNALLPSLIFYKNCNIKVTTDESAENDFIRNFLAVTNVTFENTTIDYKFSGTKARIKNCKFLNSNTKLTLNGIRFHKINFTKGSLTLNANGGSCNHLTIGNACKVKVDMEGVDCEMFNLTSRSSITGRMNRCVLHKSKTFKASVVDLDLQNCRFMANDGVLCGLWIGECKNVKLKLNKCKITGLGIDRFRTGGLEISHVASLDIDIDVDSCRCVTLSDTKVLNRSMLQKIIDNGGRVDDKTKELSGLNV